MTALPFKTEATAIADTAYASDRIVRVATVLRCPLCLRGRLRASSVRDVGNGEFAWTCAHCHRDILTITAV